MAQAFRTCKMPTIDEKRKKPQQGHQHARGSNPSRTKLPEPSVLTEQLAAHAAHGCRQAEHRGRLRGERGGDPRLLRERGRQQRRQQCDVLLPWQQRRELCATANLAREKCESEGSDEGGDGEVWGWAWSSIPAGTRVTAPPPVVDRGMTTSMPHRSWTVKEKAVGVRSLFRARAVRVRGDKGRNISRELTAVLGAPPQGCSRTLSQ